MDPWSIAAIGGFISSGLNSILNYDAETKAIRLAKEGQAIDRAQLGIDVNEFLTGMQQAKLDLGGTLDSAKGSLLDLKERKGSLGITALDYSSKIASYDEFLTRYPAYSELMVSEMDAQGKAEFRSLRENFGVSNVAAAERGQSGGSAQAMSSRAMQDLADYAGDDLSLGEMTTGNVGMFQMKKSELVLDLDAQYREAETQKGIFSTGLDQINTSIGDFETAITDSEDHITDIENAIAGWDANYAAIEAYFADLLKEPDVKVDDKPLVIDPIPTPRPTPRPIPKPSPIPQPIPTPPTPVVDPRIDEVELDIINSNPQNEDELMNAEKEAIRALRYGTNTEQYIQGLLDSVVTNTDNAENAIIASNPQNEQELEDAEKEAIRNLNISNRDDKDNASARLDAMEETIVKANPRDEAELAIAEKESIRLQGLADIAKEAEAQRVAKEAEDKRIAEAKSAADAEAARIAALPVYTVSEMKNLTSAQINDIANDTANPNYNKAITEMLRRAGNNSGTSSKKKKKQRSNATKGDTNTSGNNGLTREEQIEAGVYY